MTRRPVPYYGYGATTVFASRADQRFAYCLYVPTDYKRSAERRYRLIVAVHGTERGFMYYRDAFADVAERTGCIVLAPLFPVGIGVPGDLEGYKFLDAAGVRYDLLLLEIVAEVAETYRVDVDRFLLYGFSGGGHFAHRFFMLHPDRLAAVSIGAPGIVTLLDDRFDYWAGTRDVEARFGIRIDLAAMRDVAVHLLIGGDDTETWEIALSPDDPDWWVDGAEHQGETRLDRMAALRRSYETHGIAVEQTVVPGVGHDDRELLGEVVRFFEGFLENP